MKIGAVPGAFAPILPEQRSPWLDALRGFALLGILLYNIQAFSGYVFRQLLPPVQAWGGLDPALDWLAHVFLQGKFYSLFSFLFGLGFALQLRRLGVAGSGATSVLRRRMGWLFVFGLAHALFVWFGDILTVYAVFGLALLWFGRLPQRALLGWALFFLALPVLMYGVYFAIGLSDPLAGGRPGAGMQSPVGRAVQAFVAGSYSDVVQTQAMFYPMGWVRRMVQLQLPRIFGMFLLGIWAARQGLPALGAMQQKMLRAWLGCAISIGLPLNIALAFLGGNQALFPVGARGLLAAALASAGMPLLCLGYVAAFGLYWRGRERSLLAAAGRMPLSQYLGQSVVCVLLFYGYGFGLFGRLSYGAALLVAVAVFVCLAVLARAWFARFPQGPMEALWRRLSYARRPDARDACGEAA